MKLKSYSFITIVGMLVLLSGCFGMVKPNYQFDEAETKKLLAPGKNSIKGSGLLRQRGGGVVTCAGQEVSLVPATKYATDLVTQFYGSPNGGLMKKYGIGAKRIARADIDPRFESMQKKTNCDAQGNFRFTNVASGDYYVTAYISWQVNNEIQGGYVTKKATLSGDREHDVVLSMNYED